MSQPFWQQGGIGDALLAQHWDRINPVTGQTEFAVFFLGPQQSFVSQQAVPDLQHAALAGSSQQYLAALQQRVLSTQQEAVLDGLADTEPAETNSANSAPNELILVNIVAILSASAGQARGQINPKRTGVSEREDRIMAPTRTDRRSYRSRWVGCYATGGAREGPVERIGGGR